jgi:multiple sugar transport system ATP-binding protein
MAMIELRGLVRRHQGADAPALDRLDLDVVAGELLVLVGPSGCGKSTTLRLVAGLDAPDAGTILLDGKDVTRVPPQDRDVAMVFQGYALYPHMKVREILAFPLKMRGAGRTERERKVEEAAAMLGLSRLLDRRPGELSGGERQRVAMGRAIVRSPRVFLFDEPLSNLDAALRAELRVELAALVRRLGTTSIYVTHDQVEAMTMGDRIAVMQSGLLQQVAKPRALYESPDNVFVASFLGTPPINLIEAEARDGRLVSSGLSLPMPPGASLPARVTVGVRPERLGLVRGEGESAGSTFPAEVIAIEPLGAETHVYLDAAGTRLTARAPGFDAPSRGERVRVAVDVQSCHFFDPGSGRRIEARP